MDKVAEIVERVKAGEIDQKEATRLLEKDYYRKAKRRQRTEMPSGLMEEHFYDGTGGIVLKHEFQRAVLAVVNQLPPQQAKCVQMYYLDGFNQYQIADMLGVTQQAVAKNLRMARENISDILRLEVVKRPISRLYSEDYFSDSETPQYRPRKVRRLSFLFQYYDKPALLAYLRECFCDDKTVLPRWY